jgi:hypothetical protein
MSLAGLNVNTGLSFRSANGLMCIGCCGSGGGPVYCEDEYLDLSVSGIVKCSGSYCDPPQLTNLNRKIKTGYYLTDSNNYNFFHYPTGFPVPECQWTYFVLLKCNEGELYIDTVQISASYMNPPSNRGQCEIVFNAKAGASVYSRTIGNEILSSDCDSELSGYLSPSSCSGGTYTVKGYGGNLTISPA